MGYSSNPNWATPQLYDATAQLVAYLCEVYALPKTRVGGRIIGHSEVYKRTSGKNDPGQYWNWDHFFSLINPAPPPQQSGGGKFGGGGGGKGGGGK